jgi:D-alanyl-D-alanine carboxypeptidase (penicillin-binding protein 5/6)
MRRSAVILGLIVLAACLLVVMPVVALPSLRAVFLGSGQSLRVTPTVKARPVTPTPLPTLPPVLTVRGPLPKTEAKAVYLLDEDSGRVLMDVHGEETLPMASTTKIMTALVALQTASLEQPIPVTQDAVDRLLDDGSGAGLVVGDTLSLKDMLYALLVPSGDDAAYAIADALGDGDRAAFVQRMNLFAYRHQLFQTHYDDPDGLNGFGDEEHYTSARDLVRLAQYAMSVPMFAQIVDTQHYTVNTALHSYSWDTTNTLLGTYKGMTGIKTGHTDAAGYCLVFAATRNHHHLIGAVLGEASEEQRDSDVTKVLNWGFGLPVLPPGE